MDRPKVRKGLGGGLTNAENVRKIILGAGLAAGLESDSKLYATSLVSG
jgi:hypothetical protein